ncbi:MAG: hypothetical protein U0Z26_17485 [Anaerolineales bacterium]
MSQYSKIYYIEKRNTALIVAWVSLLLAVIWIIHFLIDLFSRVTIGWDYIIGSVVLVLALVSLFLITRYWLKNTKLIVSQTGVNCEDVTSFVGFSSNWQDIYAIQETKIYLLLWLSNPSTPTTKIGEWALSHSIIRPDVINISSFLEQWRSGELRKDFEKYAPHLFQPESLLK